MSLKKVSVEIPPELSTPPTPQKKKTSPAENENLARRLVVVAVILGAQTLLEFLPVVLQWRQTEELNSRHLLLACIFPAVLAALILVGHRVTTTLAAIFTLLLASYAAVMAFNPGLILEFAPDRAMPSPFQAAAGGALLLAAFLLTTGGGNARWTFASLVAAGGIALMLPPVQQFLEDEIFGAVKPGTAAAPGQTPVAPGQQAAVSAPLPEKPTITAVSTKLFTVNLPGHWRQLPASAVTAAGDLCVFGHDKTPQARLVVSWSLAESATPAEEARRHLDTLSAANPGSKGITSGIAGRTDRMKIYLPLSSEVAYSVVILKGNTSYTLTFRAPQDVLNGCRNDLDVIFESFLPR
jgi:hypothetical protein